MNKRLAKSTNKLITGSLAGVAEYFNLDPTIIRIAFAVVGILTGVFPVVVLYIILMLIMPKAGTSPPSSD